jgi:SAM-dependent methyltransferase
MDLPPGTPVRLNLGAGDRTFDGFLNVDLVGEPDIVADVRSIPLPDGSVEEAIAIHVLEHLYRWEAPAALREWARLIRPGGLLVLELPDLVKCCRNVVEGMMPDRAGRWGLYGDPGYKDPLMVHRWGWSPAELKAELIQAGFSRATEYPPQFHKKYRDMRIEAIR